MLKKLIKQIQIFYNFQIILPNWVKNSNGKTHTPIPYTHTHTHTHTHTRSENANNRKIARM